MKEAKFRRERAWGKEYFRGLVAWTDDQGIRQRVVCDSMRGSKQLALNDATELLEELTQDEGLGKAV